MKNLLLSVLFLCGSAQVVSASPIICSVRETKSHKVAQSCILGKKLKVYDHNVEYGIDLNECTINDKKKSGVYASLAIVSEDDSEIFVVAYAQGAGTTDSYLKRVDSRGWQGSVDIIKISDKYEVSCEDVSQPWLRKPLRFKF